jgi:hypothetical protein
MPEIFISQTSISLTQQISTAMRQLVTRQTATQFIPEIGTTLSTLLDPDQRPAKGIDWPDFLRCDACKKKNEFEFAALHTRGTRGCRLPASSRNT